MPIAVAACVRKLARDKQRSEQCGARLAERHSDGSCLGLSQWSTGGHEDYVYCDRYGEWQSGYRGSGSVLRQTVATQGLPVQVDSNGVASDTNNTLSPGSHTIQVVISGTDKFVESSASLTQTIYGLPTSITGFQRQQPERGRECELCEPAGGYREGCSW